MLAAFAALEAKVKTVIAALDADARKEYERLLADVKAEAAADLGKLGGLAGVLKADLEQAVEAAAPTVAADVKAALARFLADVAPLLAEAATGM